MNKENKTQWFVFCGGGILLKEPQKEGALHSIPVADTTPTETKEWTNILTLPKAEDGTERKAYSIDNATHIDGHVFVGLRESFGRLSKMDFIMAGKASELLYWDTNTRYCGICGAPMKRTTDISKQCTHCGKEVWPQVAPAGSRKKFPS